MTKSQAAGLLGGLTLIAVMLGSTIIGARERTFSTQYLRAMQNACAEHDQDVGACLALLETVKKLPDEDPVDAFLKVVKKLIPKGGSSDGSRCDRCVQAVADLESSWATNGFLSPFRNVCFDAYTDPDDQAACEATVNLELPPLVDFLLANYPPITACQELSACTAGRPGR